MNEVARAYKLDHQLISQWRAQLSREEIAEICLKRGQHLDDLIFNYLTQTLKALATQVEVVSDAEYLKKQPPMNLRFSTASWPTKLFDFSKRTPPPSSQADPYEYCRWILQQRRKPWAGPSYLMGYSADELESLLRRFGDDFTRAHVDLMTAEQVVEFRADFNEELGDWGPLENVTDEQLRQMVEQNRYR